MGPSVDMQRGLVRALYRWSLVHRVLVHAQPALTRLGPTRPHHTCLGPYRHPHMSTDPGSFSQCVHPFHSCVPRAVPGSTSPTRVHHTNPGSRHKFPITSSPSQVPQSRRPIGGPRGQVVSWSSGSPQGRAPHGQHCCHATQPRLPTVTQITMAMYTEEWRTQLDGVGAIPTKASL